MRRAYSAMLFLGLAAAIAAVLWWRAPGLVPDHASQFSGTALMTFAGERTLGQLVIPFRDGLTRVDLLVAAEAPALPGAAEMRVLEWPSHRQLRSARAPAAEAPVGSPWDLRAGQAGERWTAFSFEPIPDSAGRELLLELRYTGADVPDRRLATLARFPGSYPRGDLLINGLPNDGTLLFRLSAAGTHGQALRAAAWNLARSQAAGRGTLAVPATLALACLVLAADVAWAAGAVGRSDEEEER